MKQTRTALPGWPSLLLVLGLLMAMAAQPALAQQQVRIIRDAEVESLVRDFAAPLLKAAGVRALPHVYLVADRRFNAFVVEDGSLFINYGTILDSETPNALKAVLAHEIGHLAGGHIARIRERSEANARMQLVAMALGMGAVVASAGGNSEMGEVASAFMLASLSAGSNNLMAYRQSEESAADAAAVEYLEKSGQSARGMIDVLTRLSHDQVASAAAMPYLRSHPLAEDRIDRVSAAARAGRHWSRGDSAADRQALALAQAKLSGFLEPQSSVLNRYPNSDRSLAARYARIIAAYKGGGALSALAQMPKLVAEAPNNPYFHELLGQMYFETGQPDKALAPLRRAVSLAPEQTLIRVLYGQALIDAGQYQEAVTQLSRAAREEPHSDSTHALLSRAHGGLGQNGEAFLAAAEAALARGDKGTALGLARQAQKELNPSAPAWLRADDIIVSLQ